MKKSVFERLSLQEKIDQLKIAGEFVGSRMTTSHRVHLFVYLKQFVEIYVYIPTNQVQWIEFQTNRTILAEYVRDLEI